MFTLTQSGIAFAPMAIFAAKTAVVVGVLIGLIAVLSPRAFRKLSALGGMWFDTREAFEYFDQPYYVVSPLTNTRYFGTIVIAGAAALVYVTPSAAAWAGIAWATAGGLALVGCVALICPAGFRKIASVGDTWIDTSRCFSLLDAYVDVDTPVVRRSRLFGVVVLAVSGAIAMMCFG